MGGPFHGTGVGARASIDNQSTGGESSRSRSSSASSESSSDGMLPPGSLTAARNRSGRQAITDDESEGSEYTEEDAIQLAHLEVRPTQVCSLLLRLKYRLTPQTGKTETGCGERG